MKRYGALICLYSINMIKFTYTQINKLIHKYIMFKISQNHCV